MTATAHTAAASHHEQVRKTVDAGAASLIDDLATPPTVLLFSSEQLETKPLHDLYITRCAEISAQCIAATTDPVFGTILPLKKRATAPSDVVLRQLPPSTIGGSHDEQSLRLLAEQARCHPQISLLSVLRFGRHLVQSLCLDNTYLGNRGTLALLPVIAACPRLSDLSLVGIGMKAATAKALIRDVLLPHPGVVRVNLCSNELGTAVGEALVALLMRRRRILVCDVSRETCIIEPLKRRIERQLVVNSTLANGNTPAPPPMPDVWEREVRHVDEIEQQHTAARIDEERRKSRELPDWAPPMLSEFGLALLRHRRHLDDVLDFFTVGASSTAQSESSSSSSLLAHCCEVHAFLRGCRLLGCDLLANATVAQVIEFATFFGAVTVTGGEEKSGLINVTRLVSAQRCPAFAHRLCWPEDVTTDAKRDGGEASSAVVSGRLVNTLYDRQTTLRQSFELMDLDQTGLVDAGAFCIGVSAVAGCTVDHCAVFLRRVNGIVDKPVGPSSFSRGAMTPSKDAKDGPLVPAAVAAATAAGCVPYHLVLDTVDVPEEGTHAVRHPKTRVIVHRWQPWWPLASARPGEAALSRDTIAEAAARGERFIL